MSVVVFDARSPSEFNHAHIPGAVNLPLLDDEHRIIVGTTYKQKGRDAAVQAGFDLIGWKFGQIIRNAKEIAPSREVTVYCWRGGMRSAILGWVLSTAGFKVTVRPGGYKAYRKEMLDVLALQRNLIVIGGLTGSGKTEVLKALGAAGQQIVDLEGLANHKGSSFGGLGQAPQPSNEQFENLLATAFIRMDSSKPCFVENESRSIGRIKIPDPVFSQMRVAPVFEVVCSQESRIKRILDDYGSFDRQLLAECTERLEKRLGGQHLKTALMELSAGNMREWLKILLVYYDKNYQHGNSLRSPGTMHSFIRSDAETDFYFANRLIRFSESLKPEKSK